MSKSAQVCFPDLDSLASHGEEVRPFGEKSVDSAIRSRMTSIGSLSLPAEPADFEFPPSSIPQSRAASRKASMASFHNVVTKSISFRAEPEVEPTPQAPALQSPHSRSKSVLLPVMPHNKQPLQSALKNRSTSRPPSFSKEPDGLHNLKVMVSAKNSPMRTRQGLETSQSKEMKDMLMPLMPKSRRAVSRSIVLFPNTLSEVLMDPLDPQASPTNKAVDPDSVAKDYAKPVKSQLARERWHNAGQAILNLLQVAKEKRQSQQQQVLQTTQKPALACLPQLLVEEPPRIQEAAPAVQATPPPPPPRPPLPAGPRPQSNRVSMEWSSFKNERLIDYVAVIVYSPEKKDEASPWKSSLVRYPSTDHSDYAFPLKVDVFCALTIASRCRPFDCNGLAASKASSDLFVCAQ